MLLPLPFATFDQIAALGHEVEVYCPGCHRQVKVDPADASLRGKGFAEVRFRCQSLIQPHTAHPARRCNTLGHVYIKSAPGKAIRPGEAIPYAFVSCGRCSPFWAIEQAPLHDPVWRPVWDRVKDRRARLKCPGCGAALLTSWHGTAGVPFTDGFRRRA